MYIIVLIFLLFVYFIDNYSTPYKNSCVNACTKLNEVVTTQYNNFIEINKLVATQYDNSFVIFLMSCKLVCVYMINKYFPQKPIIKHLYKNRYELSYYIHNKLYKTVIDIRRSPETIISIKNKNDKELSDIILPYLGNNVVEIYPMFFNEEKLIIKNIDDTVIEYNDKLTLAHSP